MTNFTAFLQKTAIIIFCLFASITSSSAGTYVAGNSGNFNDPATWIGGQAPSSNILADIISIPSGITVTLNSDQSISGSLSLLNVDGVLTSSGNNALIINAGGLTGNGLIDVDSLVLKLALGITYTGDIITDDFTSLGVLLSTAAEITVNDHLNLNDGLLNLTAGILNFGNNMTIVVSGGKIAVGNGGLVNIGNGYNVLYVSTSSNTGWELNQPGLLGVEIDIPSTESVTLTDNLQLGGLLSLKSGELALNGHDLILGNNSAINSNGNGLIHADIASDIIVNAQNSPGGLLNFSTNGNTIGNLVLHLGNNNILNLGTDLNISGILDLQGGFLNLNDHILNIGGDVHGGSQNSYVITGQLGRLVRNLLQGNTDTFHVGHPGHYMPCIIKPNSGNGLVGIGLGSNVFANSMSGTALNTDQPLVNGTWYLTNSAALDLNIQLLWAANDEANGFDRNHAYISLFENGKWGLGNITGAITSGTLLSLSLGNLLSTSVSLAIFSEGAVTTKASTLSQPGQYILYPNPSSGNIRIKNTANGQIKKLCVIDISGKVILMKEGLHGIEPELDLTSLTTGYYTVKIWDELNNAHQTQITITK